MVGASVANADLWRTILAYQNKRRYPITVVKVAAHASEAMVLEGYSPLLRHGNSLADAAAKFGLTMHPRDRDLEADVRFVEMLIREIAKFHGRILEELRAVADDVPPIVPKPSPSLRLRCRFSLVCGTSLSRWAAPWPPIAASGASM